MDLHDGHGCAVVCELHTPQEQVPRDYGSTNLPKPALKSRLVWPLLRDHGRDVCELAGQSLAPCPGTNLGGNL